MSGDETESPLLEKSPLPLSLSLFAGGWSEGIRGEIDQVGGRGRQDAGCRLLHLELNQMISPQPSEVRNSNSLNRLDEQVKPNAWFKSSFYLDCP